MLHIFNTESVLYIVFLLLDVQVVILELVTSLKFVAIHVSGRSVQDHYLVILIFKHLFHSVLLRLIDQLLKDLDFLLLL